MACRECDPKVKAVYKINGFSYTRCELEALYRAIKRALKEGCDNA